MYNIPMPPLSEKLECEHVYHTKSEPFGKTGEYYTYTICVICYHTKDQEFDLKSLLDDGII